MGRAVRAPFPWFGGKSRAADLIWSRLGAPANYIEPFAGSLAVLLSRPSAPGTETVNDLDCYLANFWRALGADPDGVTRWADHPVNEADLHARHRWLVGQAEFRERMKSDPDYFDSKIAGWWVWGQCAWIGSGWCSGQRGDRPPSQQLPHLGDAGRGVNRGSNSEALQAYMHELSARLRGVRVACGSWERVLGDSVTWRHGLTGVLLDPPYAEGEQDYAAGGTGTSLSADVRAWAIEAGKHRLMRVALCGLEGEHDMPGDWECVPWKARGGYGSQRQEGENQNRKRERIWFSPHCLRETRGQQALFGAA